MKESEGVGCAGLDTRKGGGGGIPQGGAVAEGPVGGGVLVRGERTRSSRKTIGTLRYTTASCYYGNFGREGLG